jgi:hypothetical protein
MTPTAVVSPPADLFVQGDPQRKKRSKRIVWWHPPARFRGTRWRQRLPCILVAIPFNFIGERWVTLSSSHPAL